MAEAGATLDAIGKAIGTNKRCVRAYLKKHGIRRPDWREPPPGAHPMSRATQGQLNPAWRGGRVIDKSGYVLIWLPGHPEANRHGQVREHRVVMAQILGRPLLRAEVVHHKNKDKQDNRPENLELYQSNGEHLADELRGHSQRLTPEGRERLRECGRRLQARRRAASRAASGASDPASPEPTAPPASTDGTW